MPVPETLAALGLFAYHGTQGGQRGPLMLVVFLGVVATAAWVLFSRLRWRNTMLVLAAGWVLGVALVSVFAFVL